MNFLKFLCVIFISASLSTNGYAHSCLNPGNSAGPYDEWGFPMDTLTAGDSTIRTANDELDLIYSLLTYAVVFKTWQDDSDANHPSRGHNYGAILINTKNEIASWGRNEVFACKDDTQHAETRAIQQFLKDSGVSSLKGYTIYVGGDSCPMCAGMISQQQITRAVLGLSNPLFGKNFDRMNLDSRDCGEGSVTGLPGVTRQVIPVMSPSGIRKELDSAFRAQVAKACKVPSNKSCKAFPSQTDFLKTKMAFSLFEKANQQFLQYTLKFPKEKAANSQMTNEQLYREAVLFLKNKVSL